MRFCGGLGLLALLACSSHGAGSTHDGPPGSDAGPTASYDVIVVGAGTGGTSAAIAAARHGASVLLVEETGWVGGQMASVPEIEDARPMTPTWAATAANTGFAKAVNDALSG